MRILHFSDIHVGGGWARVPRAKWLGKRAVGAANLLAGRGKRFADGPRKLAALARFREEQRIELVLFTGDYTALGLEPEFASARAAIAPLLAAPGGFVGIPGNHDIYSADVRRERTFLRHFGDTLRTDRPELSVDDGWPLVRLFDGGVAVVALDSTRPNPYPWRSSGRLPPRQLASLARVLDDRTVAGCFVFVLNHYPPRLADGRRDRPFHRLVNDDALLAACGAIRRGALLSGHVHHRYWLRVPPTGTPLFCSGSATMTGGEGLWLFQTDGSAMQAIPGHFRDGAYRLEPSGAVAL
ncbi:MAG TPA: metallophosphoesterase [Candidatus Polarisedimenticolaceae bacterium]|nr:metallophosphoesterase [Candidatus Polarisedimenticolaceae bacterium]